MQKPREYPICTCKVIIDLQVRIKVGVKARTTKGSSLTQCVQDYGSLLVYLQKNNNVQYYTYLGHVHWPLPHQ